MNKKGLKGNARIAMGREISHLLFAFAWILLLVQFGMECTGFLSFAIMIIWFFYEIFGPSIYHVMYKMISVRIRKEQIKNAVRIRQSGSAFALLAACLVTGILIAMAEVLCVYVMKESVFYLPFLAFAPGLFFLILSSMLEGYHAACGVISYLGKIIQTAAFFIFSQLFRLLLHNTGNHVSALLRNDSYENVYKAIALALAFTVSSLIVFLVDLIMHHNVQKQIVEKWKQDNSRMLESTAMAARFFSVGFFTYLPRYLTIGTLFPIQFVIFCFRCQQNEEIPFESNNLGAIVVNLFLTGLFFLICFRCVCVRYWFEGASYYRKEEYQRLNDSVIDARHNLSLTALPTSVFLCVLAKFFAGMLSGQNADFLVPVLAVGGACIYLGSVAIYQLDLCRELGFLLESNLICITAYVAAVLSFSMILKPDKVGNPCAFAVSWLILFGIILISTWVLLNRRLGLQEEWIRSIVYPLAISALCGLVLFGFSKAFDAILNDTALCLIGFVLGYLIHSLLTVILHNVSKREAKKFTGILLIRLIGRVTGYL